MQFYGESQVLADEQSFNTWLNKHQKMEWVVYAKRPFAGPDAVLNYLARYTHRVAIANSRLVSMDKTTVSFRRKNYRIKSQQRQRTMQLTHDEFIRRFLLHVLPSRFHRIRHYGLVANAGRKRNLKKARVLLNVQEPIAQEESDLIEMVRAEPLSALSVSPPW